MTHDIIRKLQDFLGPPISEESKAVYLLTQIRKVFELDQNLAQRLPTLRFYCNWALHTRLDQARTVKAFLDEVDPVLTLQGNVDQKSHDQQSRLFTLGAFRAELREFLAANGISSTLCDNDAYWNAFLSAYSGVVEDCEIITPGTPAPPKGPLNLSVQSISIIPKNREGLELVADRPYPMDWVITYTDGRNGRLSLSRHGLSGAIVEIR